MIAYVHSVSIELTTNVTITMSHPWVNAMRALDAHMVDEPVSKRRRYGSADAKAAVEMSLGVDGEGKQTQVDAAANFEIPMTSFRRAKKQYAATGDVRLAQLGRPPRLSSADEVMLARWATYRASMRMAVSRRIFCRAAGLLGDERHKQQHGSLPQNPWIPKKNWLRGYLARMTKANEPVTVKKASIRNVKAPTRVQVEEWFDDLRDALVQCKFMVDEDGKARTQAHINSRIINVDETGIDRTDGKKIKVIAPPHRDGALAIAKDQHDHMTLVGAIDAAGGRFPPFIIMKGKRSPLELQNVKARTKNTPPNTAWECSENGWINYEVWLRVLEWIYALKKPTASDPVMVIADNHSTRYGATAIEWAMQHHVHVFVLPRNATAILQPLDLSVFSPFKKCMRDERENAIIRMQPITKVTVPLMICRSWEKAASIDTIKAGWRRAGMERFGDDMTRTRLMPNNNFRIDSINIGGSASSSSSSSSSLSSSSVMEWRAPRDVAHVLRTTAEERKATNKRGKS